ncbi:hypothetical protein [Gordonia soli]|uniref:Uncharacterized protein n=1 Tax=Gordonia soli NBRC 108243 TaxID=1223545 RepID=M0QN89_9ACTN|nr:hypothetical protein [Gordonia soli]GAC68872.1 hypothetical protein GS4_19_00620 [Gordonia soli NBRC 108243]
MAADLTPKALDQVRRRKRKYPCGMCGETLIMSKSHVPPQCAGNLGLVHRTRLIVRGSDVSHGRADRGGIHFYGLCRRCNTAAGDFDPAYGAFATLLRPYWVRDWTLQLPGLVETPDVTLRPGAVVRSLLLGMMATTTMIRRLCPDLAEQLLTGEPVDLPSNVRLRMAFARGRSARVAGTMSGFHLVGPLSRHESDGSPIGIHSLSAVYFPPLAWELVRAGPTLLDEYRWADVSDWTRYDVTDERRLPDLVPALPVTAHPWHHPDLNRHWSEMTSSELSQIIECLNIEGGPERTAGAPITLEQRSYLSMEEFEEIARRRGR